jgi:toxin ParE1/3/4
MAANKPGGLFTLKLSTRARDDIIEILAWTQEAFGDVGRTRYENLIATALIDLRNDPRRAGVRQRDDIGTGVCTYQLASSRQRVTTARQVAKPRHFVLFRVSRHVIEVARLLHEAMDFSRHMV